MPKLSYLRLEAGFCQRVELKVVVSRARRREGARGEVEGGVGVGALAVEGDDAAVAFEAALPHGAEEHPLPGGPSQGLQLSPRRSHLALERDQLGLKVNSLRSDLREVGFFLSFLSMYSIFSGRKVRWIPVIMKHPSTKHKNVA